MKVGILQRNNTNIERSKINVNFEDKYVKTEPCKRWSASAEEASSGAELVVEAILEDLQVSDALIEHP